jgi:hypothetical protein
MHARRPAQDYHAQISRFRAEQPKASVFCNLKCFVIIYFFNIRIIIDNSLNKRIKQIVKNSKNSLIYVD